ncbi:alpha/beta hydrolase [Sphingobium nicotianae]|uniref:Alpha/beta hydrolase n=1 Tax=Sphingobium nicotianae TaxID=2782607 RepID=A0A9X1IRL1_9SPHN|nr:alpha/beta hydrolase [Sphingobium nicotianae]MBT2187467.1 alpha/beta hydrolase [Sphingobium nicotianae]
MQTRTRELLKSLGCELSHGLIERTQKHLAANVTLPAEAPVVTRDLAYGPDARHCLDLFKPAGAENAPVLVFVHGGGFVRGDKRLPKMPFYDNIGCWAAEQGWIGVTINYRLAPDHMWPAGAQDVALAVAWLREHVADHGGNPRQIFLMGQAAGASHVATYLALPQVQPAGGVGVAGAVLLSGNYDPATASPNAYHLAYYGTDLDRYPSFSMVPGLVVTNVPLCFVVCEYDGIDYRRQAATLVGAYGKARGDIPRIHWLPGHNHLSPVMAVGTPYDALGPLVSDFVRGHVGG